MNNNLEFENEDLSPDSIEDNHPRTNYGAIFYKDAKGRAIFKFNGGLGALLCSKCAIIIKYGKDFSVNEMLAMQGKVKLEEQYCEKCKK